MSSLISQAARIAVRGNRLLSGRPLFATATCHRFLSSQASPSRYAVVDHSEAYEQAMEGPHGRQLELAKLEGVGKDDPVFNPFLQDELEEQKEQALQREQEKLEAGDEGEERDEVGEEEEYEEEEDFEEGVTLYNRDGSLRWKKSQLATFRAGAPAGGMFAVIALAGSQHKVTVDDLLVVNVLKPVDVFKVGSTHTLSNEQVLMVGSSHHTFVGMPYVGGAEVDVMVEEITQDGKVIVFKKKRRKQYKRKKGHRRDVTFLRILDIRPPKDYIGHKHVQRENPKP